MNTTENTTFCLHCKSTLPLCYETDIDENHKAYMCLQCGFSSNTMMISGSNYFNEATLSMPQLYVDALYKDETGKYWYPTTLNKPDTGVIFLNGTSLEDCEWAAIKAVEVKPEEIEKFKVKGQEGKYYKYKMDKSTFKTFGKDGFLDACGYIGVIENN